jgi:hypothetical protein
MPYICLDPRFTISGQVTDSKGNPVSKVRIHIAERANRDVAHDAVTDENGLYFIYNVVTSSKPIQVSARSHSPEFEQTKSTTLLSNAIVSFSA